MDFILKLLALAVFVVGTTQAQTLTLQSQTQHIDFHDHVEFLEDPNGSLSISNLHQPEVEARFRRWTDASSQISLGYSSSVWWFKIRLKTGPEAAGRWLLEIPYLQIDEIDFYAPDGQVLTLGAARPFTNRPYFHRFHLFPLDVTPMEQVWLLRVKSADSLTLPLVIWSPDAFNKESIRLFVVQAMYFGGLIALLVYNFFLAFSLNDRRFLFYALFAGHFGLAMLAGNGLAHLFIWPGAYHFDQIAQYFFLAIAAAFGMQFSVVFLEGKRNFPVLSRWLQAMGLIYLTIAGLLIISIWGGVPRQPVLMVMNLMVTPAGLMVIALAILAWRQGYKPARFFLLAWGILWVGAFVAGLRLTGWIPTNVLTSYALQIASTAEMLLLGLALADLIHIERIERESAQSRAIAVQQSALSTLKQSEDKLEKVVHERTHQLEISLDIQRQLLAQHVRFGALISHEFRNPLGILESQISLIRRESELGILQLETHLNTMASASHRLKCMFENWLKNDRLNKSLQDFQREPVPVNAWLRELVDAQRHYHADHPLTEDFGIDPGEIWIDENLMDIALTNLIDNACKYSAPGSPVHISIQCHGGLVGLCVSDQGKGIAPEHHACVFEDYFRIDHEAQVRGMGLGLAFVRKIAELHHGKIELVSNIGKGSNFCIWLPIGP
jgi:signal transduction histidine kinase